MAHTWIVCRICDGTILRCGCPGLITGRGRCRKCEEVEAEKFIDLADTGRVTECPECEGTANTKEPVYQSTEITVWGDCPGCAGFGHLVDGRARGFRSRRQVERENDMHRDNLERLTQN